MHSLHQLFHAQPQEKNRKENQILPLQCKGIIICVKENGESRGEHHVRTLKWLAEASEGVSRGFSTGTEGKSAR